MDDVIAAKPTRYAGVAFRSRLEARWAAFFDAAGWRWEYEPLDLKGWVPDFALIGKKHPVLVEVKPICWMGTADNMIEAVTGRSELDKVNRLRLDHEVLVVGAYPHIVDSRCSCLGVFPRGDFWGDLDVAPLGLGYTPRRFDFHARFGTGYRMGGEYDGVCHPRSVRPTDVESAWREAGSVVQWCPRP
jgi:hypothetical protein